MSSGMKELVINTQERAISSDVNRLQKFKSADVAELFRYALDVSGNDDLDAGAVVAEHTTLESPLRAEVINGLLVKPQAGVLDLFVDPGVLYAVAPDGAADDSNYKFVRDAGVATLGVLTMTANPGGSPRIDVIECRINPVETIVTDNRDIFNPSTGLFTASSVTKERSGVLEYRVRAGTVGGGFASVGTASGWLPLAVASVPAGAVSNDTITFWDVRPLLNDREFAPFALAQNLPKLAARTLFGCAPSTPINPADQTLAGIVEATSEGRRLGGRLRRGTPGTDAASIAIGPTTLDNVAPGTVFGAKTIFYLYLLTPFGLPRWARYTDGPAGRVPRSPRGIPVVSTVDPLVDGVPSAAVNLPTLTGLLSGTTSGACVAAGFTNSALTAAKMFGTQARQINRGSANIVPGSETTSVAQYTFTSGVDFPACAKEILVRFTVAVATVGPVQVTFRNHFTVYFPGTTDVAYVFRKGHSSAETTIGFDQDYFLWVPIPPVYPSTAGFTLRVDYEYQLAGGVPAISAGHATINGWRF